MARDILQGDVLQVLLDIRALLYLAELRAAQQSQGQTIIQFAPDVDAALEQIKQRLGG